MVITGNLRVGLKAGKAEFTVIIKHVLEEARYIDVQARDFTDCLTICSFNTTLSN
jgi:hypothetical protein